MSSLIFVDQRKQLEVFTTPTEEKTLTPAYCMLIRLCRSQSLELKKNKCRQHVQIRFAITDIHMWIVRTCIRDLGASFSERLIYYHLRKQKLTIYCYIAMNEKGTGLNNLIDRCSLDNSEQNKSVSNMQFKDFEGIKSSF